MKNIRLYVVIFLGFAVSSLKAQQQPTQKLDIFQDSLIKISKLTYGNEADDKKFADNSIFVKTLVEALKIPGSFNYTFDSLKTVSIVKSPDLKFRIISWYVQLENGTYRYYGTIQMNQNGPLKLYPLIDQSDNLADPNIITNNQKWLGARYYELIPVASSNRSPYYVLLGWKGNTTESTKKIIEILSFDKENVVLGSPVFDGKDLKGKNRIIFEYNKQNAMTLKSDRNAGMIIFDHLAPIDPEMIGKFQFYGSDGNVDGFKVIGGRLKFQDNPILKNDPHGNDELYADPAKNVKPVRKF
jgi:hypothetical protein